MVDGLRLAFDRYWAFTKMQLEIAARLGGTLNIERSYRCRVLTRFGWCVALPCEFGLDHSMNYGKDDGG